MATSPQCALNRLLVSRHESLLLLLLSGAQRLLCGAWQLAVTFSPKSWLCFLVTRAHPLEVIHLLPSPKCLEIPCMLPRLDTLDDQFLNATLNLKSNHGYIL